MAWLPTCVKWSTSDRQEDHGKGHATRDGLPGFLISMGGLVGVGWVWKGLGVVDVDVECGCGCDCWVLAWVDDSENPTRGLYSGEPRHGPVGSRASHSIEGIQESGRDGRGMMVCEVPCVVSRWDGGFCWRHRAWHVGGGGLCWPERPGGGRLLACLLACVVSRDGRFTWLYPGSVPAAGSQRVSDDLGCGPAVQWPAAAWSHPPMAPAVIRPSRLCP